MSKSVVSQNGTKEEFVNDFHCPDRFVVGFEALFSVLLFYMQNVEFKCVSMFFIIKLEVCIPKLVRAEWFYHVYISCRQAVVVVAD